MAGTGEGDSSGSLEARTGRETADLAPVVVRKDVLQRANYRDYQDDLREDFLFSCAYCALTETEAQGIGFNIDHYMPQKHYPALAATYGNLMWSCRTCNGLKKDYPEAGRIVGERRVIKVDAENPRQHLMLDGDSDRLAHRTPTGEFNIRFLLLNRASLRRLREMRRRLSECAEFIAHGMSELLAIRLDSVDRRHRGLLLNLQNRLAQDCDHAMAPIERLIEKSARSPLLDSDPNHRRELAARREFLCSEKALGPGLTLIPKTPGRRRSRKKK